MKMNDAFENYVRSTAFSISLSHNMIVVLKTLCKGDEEGAIFSALGGNSNFVQGFNGLERRGLAVHNNYPKWLRENRYHEYTGTTTGDRPAYRVTDAGKKLHELLEIAGF
jgi:hypothetical protein